MSRQPWHWTEVFIGSLGTAFVVLGLALRVRYG
jgi:hypothetical protein